MKKTIMLLLMIGMTFTAKSQEAIRVSASQDVKMFFKGATETNDDPALNTLIRIRLEGKQDKFGFFSAIAAYEYAELAPIYKRYSLNAAYTFNQLFLDDLEAGLYLGYGFIDRFGGSQQSFGYGGEINYTINEMKVGFVFQATHRQDLKVAYDDNRFVYSAFFTVSYPIFKQ